MRSRRRLAASSGSCAQTRVHVVSLEAVTLHSSLDGRLRHTDTLFNGVVPKRQVMLNELHTCDSHALVIWYLEKRPVPLHFLTVPQRPFRRGRHHLLAHHNVSVFHLVFASNVLELA